MNRYRLLDPPHKGLRNLLGHFALASGNIDVRDDDELEAFRGLAQTVVMMLADHAANEDRWIFPLAEAKRSGSTADLDSAHGELDERLDGIVEAIERLTPDATFDQVAAVHLDVTEFQARYLLHMAEEERNFEPILWSLYSDDELRAAEAQVAQSLDPALLLKWFAICAPARSVPEDAAVLRNVRQVLTPEAFDAVLATIKVELPPERFAAVARLL